MNMNNQSRINRKFERTFPNATQPSDKVVPIEVTNPVICYYCYKPIEVIGTSWQNSPYHIDCYHELLSHPKMKDTNQYPPEYWKNQYERCKANLRDSQLISIILGIILIVTLLLTLAIIY